MKFRTFLRVLTGLVLFLTADVEGALAEKRVALVIGNSAYRDVAQLRNPINDAADIGEALERIGFTVFNRTDLEFGEFRNSLREFSEAAQGAEVALVYFAGHGLEIDKQNYLLPTDARLLRDRDVDLEAIHVDQIVSSLRGAKGLKMVLLDACRHNPFVSKMRRTDATRSVGRGLGRIDPSGGTVIGFAAKEGTTAADGFGRNSPYARAILSHIEQPGLELGKLLRKVRDSVLDATDGEQEPFVYGSLPGDDIFLVAPSGEDVLAEFRQAREAATVAALDEFIGNFENSGGTVERQLVAAARDLRRLELGLTTIDRLNESDRPPVELDRAGRENLQVALAEFGMDPGPADGQFGPKTRAAISKSRDVLGLSPGDQVDEDFLKAFPDVSALKGLISREARAYSLDDLPPRSDPRLQRAISALKDFHFNFGYFEGRIYIAVLAWGYDWANADRVAQEAGGHLVTITSSAENDFVYRLFAEDDRMVEVTNGRHNGPWIGLVQDADAWEPAGGWRWVTGEALGYAKWYPGMPTNTGGQANVGEFWAKQGGTARSQWRDQNGSFPRKSFIIEIE